MLQLLGCPTEPILYQEQAGNDVRNNSHLVAFFVQFLNTLPPPLILSKSTIDHHFLNYVLLYIPFLIDMHNQSIKFCGYFKYMFKLHITNFKVKIGTGKYFILSSYLSIKTKSVPKLCKRVRSSNMWKAASWSEPRTETSIHLWSWEVVHVLNSGIKKQKNCKWTINFFANACRFLSFRCILVRKQPCQFGVDLELLVR